MQVVRWGVDLAMAVVFLISAVTGVIKFLVLSHVPGADSVILPMAFVSDIHDRAGIVLCLVVTTHLFLNRGWIITMTRKVFAGTAGLL